MIDLKVLKLLSDELVSAMADLKEFKVIFIHENLDLLNKTAPYFFIRLREFYWNRLILAASRLTDPETSSNHKNLSIMILREFSKDLPDNLNKQIEDNITIALNESKEIRNYRNWLISHRDLSFATLSDNDLPTVYLESLEKVFSAIDISLNIFYHHIDDSHYEHTPLFITSGAQSLLYYLSLGSEIEDKASSYH